jgi:hypothetical protein
MMLVGVSLGLGRFGIPLELHDSTINNRSAEGTWPHIRAHASRSLLEWVPCCVT